MASDPNTFKRYLAWLIGMLVVLTLALLAGLMLLCDRLPPPPFTGSVSFDEKAVWLAQRLEQPCEVLAIGSSITVNNLDSSLFPEGKFLNASSWGLKVQQADYFLELLLTHVDPKTVIMITTPIDFESDYRGREIFDRHKLSTFFTERNLCKTHLRYLALTYLMADYRSIGRDRHGRKTYYSLDFDVGGSVPLAMESEGFERIEKRWMKPLAQEAMIDAANYEALGHLIGQCAGAGKDFYLIQAPIRRDIITDEDREFLNTNHWPKLARICQDHGGRFQNFEGKLAFTAADFADSTHLNREGARKLSEAIVALLEK